MIFGMIMVFMLAVVGILFGLWGLCMILDLERAEEILAKILILLVILMLVIILVFVLICFISAITEGI